jgi:hypothetical protein
MRQNTLKFNLLKANGTAVANPVGITVKERPNDRTLSGMLEPLSVVGSQRQIFGVDEQIPSQMPNDYAAGDAGEAKTNTSFYRPGVRRSRRAPVGQLPWRVCGRGRLREGPMKKLLLVVAALCGLVSTAASKDDPRFLWPKNSQFSCRGVLVQDGDTYRLKADANMLAWCDADIADNNEGRVLAVCKLGDRCEIKGVIMGHGAFGWVRITSVKKLDGSK